MKNKVYLDFSVIKVFENKMINPVLNISDTVHKSFLFSLRCTNFF